MEVDRILSRLLCFAFSPHLERVTAILAFFALKQTNNLPTYTMKFSLSAVLAAACVAPSVAEIFMKEQFNDNVSTTK